MANKTLLAQIKQRSDTAANWTAKDPIISDGELIIVTTNAGEKRFKVGDGEKTFTQLPYADENILSKIKTYTAGDGISISDTGVISSTGGGSGSDIFVVETDDTGENITTSFDDIKNAIQNHRCLILYDNKGSESSSILIHGFYLNDATTTHDEYIVLRYVSGDAYIDFGLLRAPGATTVNQVHEQFNIPEASFSNPPASGVAYWNFDNRSWEIKDIASGNDTFYFEISGNNGNLTSSKTFTEIKSAIESNKHILVQYGNTLCQVTTYYMSSSSNANLLIYGGGRWADININSDNIITSQLNRIPSFSEAINSLSNSGVVYWNQKSQNWSIKPTYKAGNGISISNDGTISVTAAKIYSGTSNAPSADLGENGDIYIQTEG